jgi:hypothetical protein
MEWNNKTKLIWIVGANDPERIPDNEDRERHAKRF